MDRLLGGDGHGRGGGKRTQGSYVHGRRNGVWTEWRLHGQRESEGGYIDDVKEGPWTTWDVSGKPTRAEMVHDLARTPSH
jgi:antitoxin component YwqK of YwqJK toxin-antitoxin module